jgi:SAM-dependent methyltransferase
MLITKPEGYYDGLNSKLFESIPRNITRVLELGCANGKLGALYKSTNPHVHWTGVDFSQTALDIARDNLDRVERIDLNSSEYVYLKELGQFDVIIIGDLLEHLLDPESVLTQLHAASEANTEIICCLPNMSHISVMERFLSGEYSYDEMGLLDQTHLRLYSPSSAFKTFLDSGWIPNLIDSYRVGRQDDTFYKSLINTMGHLGVPEKTARYRLETYQMIIKCIKNTITHERRMENFPKIGVIVPVNRRLEFDHNLRKSPGLREISAQIFTVEGAVSAGQAFDALKNSVDCDWILVAHQDVYFPKNSGYKMLEELKKLEEKGVGDVPVGFAGLGLNSDGSAHYAGLVVDRTSLFSHQSSDAAVSLDECAILVRKNTSLKIDPTLQWHTWGTDLCLQSKAMHGVPNAVVINVPLFHNSLNDGILPNSYFASATVLLNKYPELKVIQTLCGTITRQS